MPVLIIYTMFFSRKWQQKPHALNGHGVEAMHFEIILTWCRNIYGLSLKFCQVLLNFPVMNLDTVIEPFFHPAFTETVVNMLS